MNEPAILYSFRRCPYAIRARLAIAASNTQVILREVALKNKPAHMLTISPKGTVPVLLLPDKKVIEQSLDIMFWALQRHDPRQLLPTKTTATLTNRLITMNDNEFKYHLDRFKYANRYTNSNYQVAKNQCEQFLFTLEHSLKMQTPSLTGVHFLTASIAKLVDLAIFPFIRQFAGVDKEYFLSLPIPHLQKWLEYFLQSELFALAMQKYPPWQEGAERESELFFP